MNTPILLPPEGGHKPTPQTDASTQSTLTKSAVALGLVVFLSVVVWIAVQALTLAPSFLSELPASVTTFTSRIFPAHTETIVIELESLNVKHGIPFTVAWSDSLEDTRATYTLSYECADALTLSFETAEGVVSRPTCGESKSFTTEKQALTVTVKSPHNRFLDASLKIDRLEGNEVLASDTALLTIVNEKIEMNRTATTSNETSVTPAPSTPSGTTYTKPTYVSVPVVSDPYGYIDLEVKIISVGILKSDMVIPSPTHTLNRDERGGVTFLITNRGTKTAPAFTFEAKLPTRPATTFEPKAGDRKELLPGASIEYTLGFNKITSKDTGVISIEVDPDQDIAESTRSNNYASIDVVIDED